MMSIFFFVYDVKVRIGRLVTFCERVIIPIAIQSSRYPAAPNLSHKFCSFSTCGVTSIGALLTAGHVVTT